MELKKNPIVDIHRKSGLFFNLALVFVLSILNLAFEWKIYDTPYKIDVFELENTQEEAIPITEPAQPPQNQQDSIPTKKTDEEEVLIKVKLDVALEGDGFDNTFFEKMKKS